MSGSEDEVSGRTKVVLVAHRKIIQWLDFDHEILREQISYKARESTKSVYNIMSVVVSLVAAVFRNSR